MKKNIVKWYRQGLWSKSMVADAVEKGILSAEDYEEICGEGYKQ